MTDPEIESILRDRLLAVEARIQAACQRAGRKREAVQLIAVTKTVNCRVIRILVGLGVFQLGENRPQSLWKKAKLLQGLPVHWHLIGQFQRNKIERTIQTPLAMIHSLDRPVLLETLEAELLKKQMTLVGLLEVNASREANKHGFAPESLPDLLPQFEPYRAIQISGLMTMASYEANPEKCRATFREVALLQERLCRESALYKDRPQFLSMGMSNDFEVAIEEGATHIRLGTVLFEGLPVEEEE